MPSYDNKYANRSSREFRSDRVRKPWRARVKMYGKTVILGSYVTYEEALAVEQMERHRYHEELKEEDG